MAHQYMHKIFHDPHKNLLPLPPPTYYILDIQSLNGIILPYLTKMGESKGLAKEQVALMMMDVFTG